MSVFALFLSEPGAGAAWFVQVLEENPGLQDGCLRRACFRPARTMSTSCHDISKRKWRNCTFLRNVFAYQGNQTIYKGVKVEGSYSKSRVPLHLPSAGRVPICRVATLVSLTPRGHVCVSTFTHRHRAGMSTPTLHSGRSLPTHHTGVSNASHGVHHGGRRMELWERSGG